MLTGAAAQAQALAQHGATDGKERDPETGLFRAAQEAEPLAMHGGERSRGSDRTSGGRGETQAYGGRGETQAYLLRRLARDAPEVLERVKSGEFKSARAAAIEAGIIRPVPTIRLVDDPAKVAAAIRKHLSPEQLGHRHSRRRNELSTSIGKPQRMEKAVCSIACQPMTEKEALVATEQLVQSFLSLPDEERENRAEEAVLKAFQIREVLKMENPFSIISDGTRESLMQAGARIRESLNSPEASEKVAILEANLLMGAARQAIKNTRPDWMKAERSLWVFF